MHVMGSQYLVSVAEPLKLTISVSVKKLDTEGLGQALTAHINLLDSHGFRAVRVIVDPQSGFTPLKGMLGEIEIDMVGTGDHPNKVDARICRLKEIMRCVIAGLPYSLPKSRCDNLVSYATGRINNRGTSALNDNITLLVKFTRLPG